MVIDPIGDLITRIRNAMQRKHSHVNMPYSKFALSVVKVLKDENFISSYEIKEDSEKPFLNEIEVELRYKDNKSAIEHIERVSKPGVRIYVGYRQIPRILGGLGISVLSTPKGVMSGKKAQVEKVGGEYLCKVW